MTRYVTVERKCKRCDGHGEYQIRNPAGHTSLGCKDCGGKGSHGFVNPYGRGYLDNKDFKCGTGRRSIQIEVIGDICPKCRGEKYYAYTESSYHCPLAGGYKDRVRDVRTACQYCEFTGLHLKDLPPKFT